MKLERPSSALAEGGRAEERGGGGEVLTLSGKNHQARNLPPFSLPPRQTPALRVDGDNRHF